jgi:isopenicillin-N epimerase
MADTADPAEISWQRVPHLFSLEPGVAHLNHGSFGAVPRPVARAQQHARDEMEANPMAFFARTVIDRVAQSRSSLATAMGADPELTALVPNATTAAQTVLNRFDLTVGDEILLTDHGYGAVRMAAERVCVGTGATIREVAIPLHTGDASAARLAEIDDEIVDTVVAAVRPGRTRLAVVDHITSPTAKLLPAARLVRALRELGVPVLVDAAHAPGMLPVDVAGIGADFWLGNLHKWAFAPRPTALLSVSAAHRPAIRALVVSWQNDLGFPRSLEFSGTLDYTSWLAAPAGIAFMDALGADRIRRRNGALAEYGQRALVQALGIDPDDVPVAPAGDAPVSMRLVPLPRGVVGDRTEAVALRDRIAADLRSEVALDVWRGQAYLRLSAQIYNRAEDYDRLAERLPGFLAGWAGGRARAA